MLWPIPFHYQIDIVDDARSSWFYVLDLRYCDWILKRSLSSFFSQFMENENAMLDMRNELYCE